MTQKCPPCRAGGDLLSPRGHGAAEHDDVGLLPGERSPAGREALEGRHQEDGPLQPEQGGQRGHPGMGATPRGTTGVLAGVVIRRDGPDRRGRHGAGASRAASPWRAA